MPHHNSCKKRMRQSEKARIRNKQMKSRITSSLKKVLEIKDPSQAQDAAKNAFSVLDKAVKAKVIHANKAANQKSRISKLTTAPAKA